jgi:hypothetical protein
MSRCRPNAAKQTAGATKADPGIEIIERSLEEHQGPRAKQHPSERIFRGARNEHREWRDRDRNRKGPLCMNAIGIDHSRHAVAPGELEMIE